MRQGRAIPEGGTPAGISQLSPACAHPRVHALPSHTSQVFNAKEELLPVSAPGSDPGSWDGLEGMRSCQDAAGLRWESWLWRGALETPPDPAARTSLLRGAIRTGLQQGWGWPR